jgi:uncharacterized membrane protein
MNVPDHVNASIDAMASLHDAERQMTAHQRTIEHLTWRLTRPLFVYGVVAFVLGWIALNAGLHQAGRTPFDESPYHLLHLVLTFGAFLMATFVLATQERQVELAHKRSQLDLQINLLSEQKIAKLIGLIEELRRDLPGVHKRVDEGANAMAAPSDPQVVADALADARSKVA